MYNLTPNWIGVRVYIEPEYEPPVTMPATDELLSVLAFRSAYFVAVFVSSKLNKLLFLDTFIQIFLGNENN